MPVNTVRAFKALPMLSMWLMELEAATADRRLSLDEAQALLKGLAPVLAIYGVDISPLFDSPITRNIAQKLESVGAVTDVINRRSSG